MAEIDAVDEALGLLELFAQVRLGLVLLHMRRHGPVRGVDLQVRQIEILEADLVRPIVARRDHHLGPDRARRAAELARRTRVARADDVERLAQLRERDAHVACDGGGGARLELNEMALDEPLEQRGELAALPQLQQQALGQVARAHARGLELLDEREDLGHLLLGNAEGGRRLVHGDAQVAVAVDVADEILPDGLRARAVGLQAQLLQQVLVERVALGQEAVERERALGQVAALGIERLRAAVAALLEERIGAHVLGVPLGREGVARLDPVVIVEERVLLHALPRVLGELLRRHAQDGDALLELGGEVQVLLQAEIGPLVDVHEAASAPSGTRAPRTCR